MATDSNDGPIPSVPGNIFAGAVEAGNAALAASEAAGTALDAGVADLDRRTAEELSVYEMVGTQAGHNTEDNPSR